MEARYNWVIFKIPDEFISFEMRVNLIPVHLCEDGKAMFEVILPFAFVLAAVSVVEHTVAVTLAI